MRRDSKRVFSNTNWLALSAEKLVPFLQAKLGSYSGKSIRRLLEANLCRINGQVERFGSRLLQGGDRVELAPTWKTLLSPQPLTFETLYEDEHLCIVNKPAGWVCQETEAKKTFGPGRYLVHRLDKETTGLLILAKNIPAREEMEKLFAERAILKRYVALVDGVPLQKGGVQKSFFAKKGAFQGQTIWGSAPRGLTAITRWKTVAKGNKASFLLCEPLTGRTHQIRVHMAEMGHPILVDRQYAKRFHCPHFFQRPLLHAYQLLFSFQNKEIAVRAELPVDICEALREMGMEMGHLRQLLRKEEEDDSREQGQKNKNTEEVEESSHFVHEPS